MSYTAGPFVAPHLYLQWGGKLPGNESWSCGVRFSQIGTGPWPTTDPGSLIGAAETAVQAMHVRAATQISSAAKLSFVKWNAIGTDGLYVLPTTYEQIVADVAGGGSNQPPNQITLAITLNTAVSRGPAHQGRFYLPMSSLPAASDGLISVADATAVKGSLTTFLNDLNAISPRYAVAVHSRKLGAPAQRPVTSVSVGRVLDTQRRRRRSLAETYV